MSYPVKSKERREAWGRLLNEIVYIHNFNVVKDESGLVKHVIVITSSARSRLERMGITEAFMPRNRCIDDCDEMTSCLDEREIVVTCSRKCLENLSRLSKPVLVHCASFLPHHLFFSFDIARLSTV